MRQPRSLHDAEKTGDADDGQCDGECFRRVVRMRATSATTRTIRKLWNVCPAQTRNPAGRSSLLTAGLSARETKSSPTSVATAQATAPKNALHEATAAANSPFMPSHQITKNDATTLRDIQVYRFAISVESHSILRWALPRRIT
ncbi:MAG: hypothetical protein ACRDJC_20740 [Thermomicrobiales bacterium]